VKIIIRSPAHKGSGAELWGVHSKMGAFLRKRNLQALRLYTPVHVDHSLTFEIKSSEHFELILGEIRSLLAQKQTWSFEVINEAG
jgi:hypothetical protein